jgi:hypothetical protein
MSRRSAYYVEMVPRARVGIQDLDAGKGARSEARREVRIDLERHHAPGALSELRGERALSRTDLDHEIARGRRHEIDDRARDAGVAQEVLAERLSPGHGIRSPLARSPPRPNASPLDDGDRTGSPARV